MGASLLALAKSIYYKLLTIFCAFLNQLWITSKVSKETIVVCLQGSETHIRLLINCPFRLSQNGLDLRS